MARTVFFSFHYRDIFRVQNVKQHHVTKGNYTAAGFFDGSLEERAKTEGDETVKRLINGSQKGCTVLCVLIGPETYQRRWVDYEIFKGVAAGMGVFGIRIHQIPDLQREVDPRGPSPFHYLGYRESGAYLQPVILYQAGWKDAPYQNVIAPSAVPYLTGPCVLENIFSVYDWQADRGYDNFGVWVEAAARQAGN